MTCLRRLVRDPRGASAAEFALVLPLLLILILGLIDSGRFIWEYNRAEKATQMGARYAVATDPVLASLGSFSFTIDGGLPQGNVVPVDDFESATCDASNCTCNPSSGDFCAAAAHNPVAFANLVARMATMYPPIEQDNVRVEYRNVGIGYSGDPNGPDVVPLVTVWLTGLEFRPITFMLFGGDITMPPFRAALTLEDGSGSVSN